MNAEQMQAAIDAAVAAALLAQGGQPPPAGPQGPLGPAGPPGPPPQVAPPPPVVFALAPALLSNQPLNYNVPADSKLYYKAISPLEPKFDLSASKIRGFLQAFYDKAIQVNWQMTLSFMIGAVQFNLIEHYGSITMAQVLTHAQTYLATNTRHAQNSMQIYACLSQSLTDEAKDKVALESSKYTIGGVTEGLLFFKVLVGVAQVDTRATITVIRARLSSLDTKISDLQDNIPELNQFVKTQQAGLTARGERTDDLLVNLFKAYKACGDEEFLRWVKGKEDDYNEGTNFSPEELMTLADGKYTALQDDGTWLQNSSDKKKIVAMAAQIETLKSKSTEKKSDNKKGSNNKKKDKGKKDKKGGGKDKSAWYYQAPAAGQPTKKAVNGKDFHWCIHHEQGKGKWVRHTLVDCDVRKALEAKNKAAKSSGGSSQTQMQVAGMVAVLSEDDDY